MKPETYLEQHKEQLLQDLFSLLRIPSISSLSSHKQDMVRCAEQWQKLMLKAGVDHCEVMPTEGNPIVFAEKRVAGATRTVMVYGHYDVMPVEPLELWDLEPFEPQILDGYIRARGADDDKGQSFMHYAAFQYLMETGQLRHNIKFLLEGEEEISSPSLPAFLEAHKEMLQADIILVSDNSMLSAEHPSITTGLRGLAYWELCVSCADKDLHSGIFGGAVANPINELCKLIAKLQDENGRICVPGFYDDVEEVSQEERNLIAATPFDEKEYKKSLGVHDLFGEKGYSTLERTGIRPTLDLCGIWGGYTGEGAKTVLPAKAYAKLSTRLVPHQNYQKIAVEMEEYLKSIAPEYVDLQVQFLHGADSYVCPIDLPDYKRAEKAYESVFHKRPLPVRRGGSIGVVPLFEKVLGVKSILMGFGLESDQIHSPNENFPVQMWMNGIRAIVAYHLQD